LQKFIIPSNGKSYFVKANKDNTDETIRILNGMLKTSMPEEKETE
jgi:hypothetical protein